MELQLKGSGAELSSRVQNLRTISRVQANSIGAGGFVSLPGSTKIHEQSLADMQEVRVNFLENINLTSPSELIYSTFDLKVIYLYILYCRIRLKVS